MKIDSHPNAEIIYQSVKTDFPTMSLATVYKTLDALSSCGLIKELGICGHSARYDARIETHTHIVCRKCGQVHDVLDVGGIDEIKLEVEKQTGFSIVSEQLCFFGYCKDCN